MNKDRKNIYRRLLEEYFKGTLDDKLAHKVRGWIPESKDPTQTDGILREKFDDFVKGNIRPTRESLAAWERLSKRLGFPAQKVAAKGRTGSLGRRWMKIAAVILPLAILAGYLFIVKPLGSEVPVVGVNYTAQVTAPYDSKKMIFLPDGTQVYLNEGAQLEFDSTGYSTARNVRLHGEAYFSVVENENNAFTVDAGEIKVRVLGTEFNVKTTGQGNFSEVSLFSGSVEVRSGDKVTLLQPKQQLLFNKQEKISLVKEFDPQTVGEWRHRLSLNNVSLPRAFSMIEDYFGMPVVIRGNLPENNSIRVAFEQPTVTDAMDILKMITSGFEYRISGDSILITGK